MPSVIGIDPSLTGFAACAVSGNSTDGDSAVFHRSSKAASTIRARVARYEGLVEGLREWIHESDLDPVAVLIEGYAFSQVGRGATDIRELGGVLRRMLVRAVGPECQFHEIPPTTLKKFVTGKGKIDGKTEVISAIVQRFGVMYPNDDCYDAHGLAWMGQVLLGHWEPMTKEQAEAVNAILNPKVKVKKKRGQC